ncbi:PadR family transcriptional regulator [Zongyangia hominis]|uniref:PadR family transcriptional regulator n=1 Tax=Zongyangia hominis TaxID=2763677 RepID=A0A926ED86_9FIRM|nr:PadR family transcriptional regulator [Zongyangia hominis]MBC8569622.1 PadR family transcriptional regulator [Zongyangia hominis]
MIPLYILGILTRFGPQHGYQIKKMLMEQMADFTDIKLPTIYYHLEKMEATGIIAAQHVKEGVRPEKRVYHVTNQGNERFLELLRQTLEMEYRPTFDVDAALFFSDYVDRGDFIAALQCHAANQTESLERIAVHREQVLSAIPENMRGAAALIFAHHELHYQAERSWAEQAIEQMKEGRNDDEAESH